MKQHLDLSVRSATVPHSGAFDTRPRAVTRWVANLRTAHLDETAQRLWHALAEVNGLAISPARRFHVLESFGPTAALALDHLRQRYTHQPLPLSPAADRAALQAIDLLVEFLRGYRTLLAQIAPDKEPLSPWRRFWIRRPLGTSLHRSIHYGGELLSVYRRVHRDVPAGLWKRIHRSYYLAETHGVLLAAPPLPGNSRRAGSVADEYRRLLLLSLLPPDGLAAAQWEHVLGSLPEWVRQTRLVPAPIERGQAYCHMVRLARDTGPLALNAVDEQGLTGPDTRGLAIALLRKGLEGRLEGGSQLTPETLQFLLDNWCSERLRAEPRRMHDGQVEVIVGLAALHHLLGKHDATSAEQTPSAPPRRELSLAPATTPATAPPRSGRSAIQTGAADIWRSVYLDPEKVARPEPQASAWCQPAKVEKPYCSFAGRMLDRSKGGCRVQVERGAVQNMASGMLMALRGDEQEPWQVGVIARLKAHGDNVELGARMIGADPLPVTLHTRSGRGLSTFPAVLGRDGEGRHLLIAPAMPAVREGELVIEIGEHRVPVKRIGKATHSRHMAACVIKPLREEDQRHLEPAPPAPAPAPVVEESAASPAPEPVRSEPAVRGTPETPKAQAPSLEQIEQLMRATGMRREDAEFFLIAEAEHETDPCPLLKKPG